jgi:phosphoribosylformylglycinamidine synthase
MYKAKICVTLRPSILDPQGKAARRALHELGYNSIEQLRMGKYIEMWVEGDTEEAASETVDQACHKLLSNPVMED